MLGLLLIYFIGKGFYQLADSNKKSTWGYAILGVASYYAFSILAGIGIVICYELTGTSIDDLDETMLGLMGVPFGILGCYLTYKFLQKKWNGEYSHLDPNILDVDIVEETAY